MKVSIHVITYNDGNNITRALTSALDQKVNFDYEIVIGDDASSDSTRELLNCFKRRHPHRIRLLFHEKNLGDKGKTNFVKTLNACRGEYVALLPGDDYWTSQHKLQKQVNFLDTHSTYSACFHNVLEVDEGDPQRSRLLCNSDQKQELTIMDLLLRNHIPTSSLMFRRTSGSDTPEWFFYTLNGDWLRNILIAERGRIQYLDEVMGVYRKHAGGVWSTLTLSQQVDQITIAYRHIDRYLNFKYHDLCLRGIREHGRLASHENLGRFHTTARSGDFAEAVPFLIKSVKADPLRFAPPLQLAYILKSCILCLLRRLGTFKLGS